MNHARIAGLADQRCIPPRWVLSAWLVTLALLPAAVVQAAAWEPAEGAHSAALSGSTSARNLGAAGLFANPASLAFLDGMALEAGGSATTALVEVHQGGTRAPPWAARARTMPWLDPPPVLPALAAAHGLGRLAVAAGIHGLMADVIKLRGEDPAHGRGMERLGLGARLGLAYRVQELSVGGAMTLAAARLAAQQGGAEGDRRWLGAGGGLVLGFQLRSPGHTVVVGGQLQSRLRLALWSAGGSSSPGPAGWLEDARVFTGNPELSTMDVPDGMTAAVGWSPLGGTRLSVDGSVRLWSLAGALPAVSTLRDTFTVRVGVEQALLLVAPDLKARAGMLAQSSPTPPSAHAPLGPYADRLGASVGVGWRLFGLTMDAAYAAEVGIPRAVSVGGQTYEERSTAHQVVVSVGYRSARLAH